MLELIEHSRIPVLRLRYEDGGLESRAACGLWNLLRLTADGRHNRLGCD